MRIIESEQEFRRRLDRHQKPVHSLRAEDAVSLMTSFFREVRAVDAQACSDRAMGDGLLYQWGTYDWGSGESFEFGLTRQFAMAGEIDDDALYQLHLILKYAPTTTLRQLDEGNEWCWTLDDLDAFEKCILAGDPLSTIRSLAPTAVEVRLEKV